MNKTEAYIVCQDLFKTYKGTELEVVALRGIDLEIMQGEFVGIIGYSGSGKTTLLNVLSGLDKPSSGQVRIGHRDLLNMSESDLVAFRREEVGFVWQSPARNILPYLKAVENVELPMVISGQSSADRRERAMDLLSALGLEAKATRYPDELSGGEQQRVAIAVALANRPGLLLADEPTGELDTRTADDVLKALQDVCVDFGVTVVVVTHYSGTSRFTDRVVQIRDGRIVAELVSQASKRRPDQLVTREYLVVDRAGRMQLPLDSLKALGTTGRVRIDADSNQIVLKPEGSDS
ncbi:MAG: ABC-type lipoprotein export system, ATPase component [Chloroflexi bacterium]|nr:MAG: ABC-type lipoprotein export system, ATPase component [Chloroflexota bacterium]